MAYHEYRSRFKRLSNSNEKKGGRSIFPEVLSGELYRRWIMQEPWITIQTKYLYRLVCTLIGAYLPLFIALILYHPLQEGNPYFFISMLTSVVGYYLPGWIKLE